MDHHLRELATEYTARVLQRRKFLREDGPCQLDSTHQQLYALPSQLVQRHAYFVDREREAERTS